MNTNITEHPAYIAHVTVARYEGFALLKVTYSEEHEDYEGGTRLECWDDNDEYVEDVDSKEAFESLVDDILTERAECEDE